LRYRSLTQVRSEPSKPTPWPKAEILNAEPATTLPALDQATAACFGASTMRQDVPPPSSTTAIHRHYAEVAKVVANPRGPKPEAPPPCVPHKPHAVSLPGHAVNITMHAVLPAPVNQRTYVESRLRSPVKDAQDSRGAYQAGSAGLGLNGSRKILLKLPGHLMFGEGWRSEYLEQKVKDMSSTAEPLEVSIPVRSSVLGCSRSYLPCVMIFTYFVALFWCGLQVSIPPLPSPTDNSENSVPTVAAPSGTGARLKPSVAPKHLSNRAGARFHRDTTNNCGGLSVGEFSFFSLPLSDLNPSSSPG